MIKYLNSLKVSQLYGFFWDHNTCWSMITWQKQLLTYREKLENRYTLAIHSIYLEIGNTAIAMLM